MDNKIPEKSSEIKMNNHKKTDKIRRKLLIGAVATPLVLTLSGARAWGDGVRLRDTLYNPSKADRDGVGYSGMPILRGESGGTEESELALYVILMTEGNLDKLGIEYRTMVDNWDNEIKALPAKISNSSSPTYAADLARARYVDEKLYEAIVANDILSGSILPYWAALHNAVALIPASASLSEEESESEPEEEPWY